jgi:mannosylglucosylglycerate synthase
VARLAIVSYRLGGTDGVSIEAAKWREALRALGHDVVEVAGAGPVDVLVEGLRLDAASGPAVAEVATALDGMDLVIVENVASLPLNVAARDVLYEVLWDRPALFHHHDLASQRPHLAHLAGPLDRPLWHHVTINDLSRAELAASGVDATTIMNSFDCDPPRGDRDATRRALGVERERVVVLPSRAIARKNVAGALELCSALGATFWLLGPAEDGYEVELERLLDDFDGPVRRGGAASIHDAYAAADLVVVSSSWEGFGNPVLESVTHRRPLALAPYPVAREITAFGFEFFGLDDVEAINAFLDHPNEQRYERNLEVARTHFNVETLGPRLAGLLEEFAITSRH